MAVHFSSTPARARRSQQIRFRHAEAGPAIIEPPSREDLHTEVTSWEPDVAGAVLEAVDAVAASADQDQLLAALARGDVNADRLLDWQAFADTLQAGLEPAYQGATAAAVAAGYARLTHDVGQVRLASFLKGERLAFELAAGDPQTGDTAWTVHKPVTGKGKGTWSYTGEKKDAGAALPHKKWIYTEHPAPQALAGSAAAATPIGAKPPPGTTPKPAMTIGFHLVNEKAAAAAKQHVATLVTKTTAETQQAIRDVIHKGIAEGFPPREMAKHIRQLVGLNGPQAAALAKWMAARAQEKKKAGKEPDWQLISKQAEPYARRLLRQRALLIARTETVRASNMGQNALWGQAIDQGLIDQATTFKKWIPYGTACKHCKAIAAAGPIPVQGTYFVGIQHPPAHPACRCAEGLVFQKPAVPEGGYQLPAPEPEPMTPQEEALQAVKGGDMTPADYYNFLTAEEGQSADEAAQLLTKQLYKMLEDSAGKDVALQHLAEITGASVHEVADYAGVEGPPLTPTEQILANFKADDLEPLQAYAGLRTLGLEPSAAVEALWAIASKKPGAPATQSHFASDLIDAQGEEITVLGQGMLAKSNGKPASQDVADLYQQLMTQTGLASQPALQKAMAELWAPLKQKNGWTYEQTLEAIANKLPMVSGSALEAAAPEAKPTPMETLLEQFKLGHIDLGDYYEKLKSTFGATHESAVSYLSSALNMPKSDVLEQLGSLGTITLGAQDLALIHAHDHGLTELPLLYDKLAAKGLGYEQIVDVIHEQIGGAIGNIKALLEQQGGPTDPAKAPPPPAPGAPYYDGMVSPATWIEENGLQAALAKFHGGGLDFAILKMTSELPGKGLMLPRRELAFVRMWNAYHHPEADPKMTATFKPLKKAVAWFEANVPKGEPAPALAPAAEAGGAFHLSTVPAIVAHWKMGEIGDADAYGALQALGKTSPSAALELWDSLPTGQKPAATASAFFDHLKAAYAAKYGSAAPHLVDFAAHASPVEPLVTQQPAPAPIDLKAKLPGDNLVTWQNLVDAYKNMVTGGATPESAYNFMMQGDWPVTGAQLKAAIAADAAAAGLPQTPAPGPAAPAPPAGKTALHGTVKYTGKHSPDKAVNGVWMEVASDQVGKKKWVFQETGAAGPTTAAEAPPAPLKPTGPMSAIPASFDDFSAMTAIAGPHGSQSGQWYRDTSGHDFYVKPATSADHAFNEVGGALVYQVAGATAGLEIPHVSVLTDRSGKRYIVSQKVESAEVHGADWWTAHPEARAKAEEQWAVDVLLSHWDVVGANYDNLLTTGVGEPIRIEAGGAMAFRAMGQQKPEFAVGAPWAEVWSMRGKKPPAGQGAAPTNAQLKTVFGHISDQRAGELLETLKKLDLDQVAAKWAQLGMPLDQQQRNLAVLKYRIGMIPALQDKLGYKPAPAPAAKGGMPALTTIPKLEEIAQLMGEGKVNGVEGQSFAWDDGSVEDLDVRVTRVRQPQGDGFELRFKVTAATKNKLERLQAAGNGWASTPINAPNKTVGPDGFTVTGGNALQRATGTTYVKQMPWGEIRVHHGSKALDGTVQVWMRGDQYNEAAMRQASRELGVVEGYPSGADIRAMKEARLLYVLDPAALVRGGDRTAALEAIRQKFGITADDVEMRVGTNGRVEFRAPEALAERLMAETGVECFIHSGSNLEAAIAEGHKALLSTTARWLEGVGTSGMSSSTDLGTGGADYVFTRQQTYANASRQGEVIVIDAKSALRRLDWFAYTHDNYGRVGTGEYNQRTYAALGAHTRGSQETMFKHRVGFEDIEYVVTSDPVSLIRRLRASGITDFAGRPLEEVIVKYGTPLRARGGPKQATIGAEPMKPIAVQAQEINGVYLPLGLNAQHALTTPKGYQPTIPAELKGKGTWAQAGSDSAGNYLWKWNPTLTGGTSKTVVGSPIEVNLGTGSGGYTAYTYTPAPTEAPVPILPGYGEWKFVKTTPTGHKWCWFPK